MDSSIPFDRKISEEAVSRIREMEAAFDQLQNAAPEERNSPEFQALLKQLTDYYSSPQWLLDYQLDEQGLLPEGLKRGILSEDGIYNFLSRPDFQPD